MWLELMRRVNVWDNTLALLQDSKQLVLECKSPVSPPLAPRPRPTSAVTHRVLVFGLGVCFPIPYTFLKVCCQIAPIPASSQETQPSVSVAPGNG